MDAPIFSAVSPSARQLYLLLRCISFASKTQVRISPEGLRFSAQETSVMEAFVFLSRSLFTTYNFQRTESSGEDTSEQTPQHPTFQVSLPAFLETLQIFSLGDSSAFRQQESYDTFAAYRQNRSANNPFSATALGASGLCRISYETRGSPLTIHLSESDVSTNCDLTTYEAETADDIPFDRESLALKTIMRSMHLGDAISELATANPTTLTLLASPSAPYLSLSASGPLGSATVEFDRDKDPQLLETFQCPTKFVTSYNFGHVKSAYRAMASASKVSLRVDQQGVLSLQFLIEYEPVVQTEANTEGIAFVDFRIVPLAEGEAVRENDMSTEEE